MESKDNGHNGNLAVFFYAPRPDAAQLDEIAESLQVSRATILRSIIHATLEKLSGMEKPPTTLGGIENTIKGNER